MSLNRYVPVYLNPVLSGTSANTLAFLASIPEISVSVNSTDFHFDFPSYYPYYPYLSS